MHVGWYSIIYDMSWYMAAIILPILGHYIYYINILANKHGLCCTYDLPIIHVLYMTNVSPHIHL